MQRLTFMSMSRWSSRDYRACRNVVLTPHLGSAALDTRERVAAIVVDNVIAVIEGRRPPNLYNPEIYGHSPEC